ncbi:hypothetical protein HYU07_05020 [Candidatus Woesearchaeota archaeon]|nr:hypothetical protein [Candidatus Woesearchaeota archaeon]
MPQLINKIIELENEIKEIKEQEKNAKITKLKKKSAELEKTYPHIMYPHTIALPYSGRNPQIERLYLKRGFKLGSSIAAFILFVTAATAVISNYKKHSRVFPDKGVSSEVEETVKEKIGRADKAFAFAKRDYNSILKGGITNEEKTRLPVILDSSLVVYDGLNIDKKRAKRTNDLIAEIQETISAERLFDSANSLFEKGKYYEANDKIGLALKILPKERKYQALNAKAGTLGAKLTEYDNILGQIENNFNQLMQKRMNAAEITQLESSLASLSGLYSGLKVDEKRIESVHNLELRIKNAVSYNSVFYKIKEGIIGGKYGDDKGARQDILALAAKLEKENSPYAKFLLDDVKNLSYTKLVKVEAKTERVVDQAGHYEQAWVPPEYEKNVAVGIAKGTIMVLTTPIAVLIPPSMNESETFKKFDNWLGDNEVKVKEGHYENKWIGPTYKDVIVPSHYQKIEVNSYSGTQKVIEDNIPIK